MNYLKWMKNTSKSKQREYAAAYWFRRALDFPKGGPNYTWSMKHYKNACRQLNKPFRK